ncbi:uncharacterized protein LOC123511350 [Portunus trituberculatus]|uniref:uncharacterized protein LOC123511350 n=1 Tax=Portunus trituberculatus TaxID=210409 RepID=UPI001E1D1459|nr:uncharacterized protein LOC123511350 [Portunus trituberculatus]
MSSGANCLSVRCLKGEEFADKACVQSTDSCQLSIVCLVLGVSALLILALSSLSSCLLLHCRKPPRQQPPHLRPQALNLRPQPPYLHPQACHPRPRPSTPVVHFTAPHTPRLNGGVANKAEEAISETLTLSPSNGLTSHDSFNSIYGMDFTD